MNNELYGHGRSSTLYRRYLAMGSNLGEVDLQKLIRKGVAQSI
jgi:hypothetical protein